MRTYTLNIMRDYSFEGHYYELADQRRVRPLVIELFREEFGHEPTFHWHKDGFMAEARDDRGNVIQLEQTNHWCPFLGPLPIMRRPCLALTRRAA